MVKHICLVGMSVVETLNYLMSSRQDDIIKNITVYVSKLVDRFEQGHKYSYVITQLII